MGTTGILDKEMWTPIPQRLDLVKYWGMFGGKM